MIGSRPLRTEAEYDEALAELDSFFALQPARGSPEADRFDLLALLVADYERRHWPIEPPDPTSAILYVIEIGQFSRDEFAKLVGSESRASDILSGRRPLTLRLARVLHRRWGIPAESLLGEARPAAA